MSVEYALTQIDARVKLADTPANLALQPTAWWTLTQVVLAGLLVTYLTGAVQDARRIRDLRAEPPALSKIIVTKNEAWQRIHGRPMRSNARDILVPTWTRDAPKP
jgi:hypothetical protein